MSTVTSRAAKGEAVGVYGREAELEVVGLVQEQKVEGAYVWDAFNGAKPQIGRHAPPAEGL